MLSFNNSGLVCSDSFSSWAVPSAPHPQQTLQPEWSLDDKEKYRDLQILLKNCNIHCDFIQ